MRILFYGGRDWGYSQDLYNHVFKALGAKQHKTKTGVDLEYLLDVLIHSYDLIWCEGEASHAACMMDYLSKTYTLGSVGKLYRSQKAKIVSRFHYHDVKPYLEEFTWKAIMALTYSDQAVCVSEYWRREIMKFLPVFKDIVDIKIVHNGVDTSKYVPSPSLKENNIIFYLAITDKRKRLHLLIQAMKYLKEWKLFIGGKGKEFEVTTEEWKDPTIPLQYRGSKAYWEWCHKLSEPYKDRIEWTGFLSEEEKLRMYQRATVFCLPSRIESWGVTPMEAMACGTPAVVTNAGGLPEFVPASQLLPPMVSPKEIADKIAEVSQHPEWGQMNRSIVKAYDWQQIAKEVKTVISEVMPY